MPKWGGVRIWQKEYVSIVESKLVDSYNLVVMLAQDVENVIARIVVQK